MLQGGDQMSPDSIRARAVALLLTAALSGCSVVGLGYRAGHSHASSSAEAERLTRMAQMYERQGHPSGAMRLYRQALYADPQFAAARQRLMALSSQRQAPSAPDAVAPAVIPGTAPTLAAAPTLAPEVIQALQRTAAINQPPDAAMPHSLAAAPAAIAAVQSPDAPRQVATLSPPHEEPESVASVQSRVAPLPSPVHPPPVVPSPQVAEIVPPLAPEPPTSTVALQPNPTPTPSPRPAAADGWAAFEARHLPLLDSTIASSVAHSAALAAAAAAAAPLQDILPSRVATAAPTLAVAPGPLPSTEPHVDPPPPTAEIAVLPPAEGPDLLSSPEPDVAPPPPAIIEIAVLRPAEGPDPLLSLEPDVAPAPPATMEIAVMPPEDGPRITPATPSTHRGWTATNPEPQDDVGRTSVSPSSAGIEIRPQESLSDPPARVEIATPDWGPTDLERLCPSASADLLSLVRRLESPDVSLRKDALIELGEQGELAQPVVAAVRSRLEDAEPLVQAHAAWAVCRITGADDAAIAVLTRILETNDRRDAAFAAYCLGLLGDAAVSAAPALHSACTSEVSAVRLCAAEALLKIAPEDAEPVSALISALHGAEPEARWLAALSLASVSDTYREAAITALIPVLADPEADVSSSAALALGAFGPDAQPAVPDLQAVLSHPNSDVRDAAATALACIVE